MSNPLRAFLWGLAGLMATVAGSAWLIIVAAKTGELSEIATLVMIIGLIISLYAISESL